MLGQIPQLLQQILPVLGTKNSAKTNLRGVTPSHLYILGEKLLLFAAITPFGGASPPSLSHPGPRLTPLVLAQDGLP